MTESDDASLLLLQHELVTAIEQEDLPKLEYLLVVKNVNPNFEEGKTPPIQIALFRVCRSDCPSQIANFRECLFQTVKLLLDAGADPNPTCHSLSPLQRGISHKNLEIVKLLVERGAMVNTQGGIMRSSPLHTAIFYNCNDCSMIKFLLDCNADVNSQNNYGDTPVHELIASTKGSTDVCKMLIEAGADLNLRNDTGYTPLLTAVSKGNIAHTVVLLEGGSDLLATAYGLSALHLARAKPDMIEFLLKLGVPIESRDSLNFTPLHLAVYHQNIPSALCLVKAGANVNTLNVTGDIGMMAGTTRMHDKTSRRPIYIAGPRQDMRSLDILLKGGSRVTKELCEVESIKSSVLVSDHSNPLGAYMEYLSCHTQSLQEICILIIRQMLAPHLQTKAYLLPVPYAFQKEIALESLVVD